MWSDRKKFAQAWNFGPCEENKPVSWIIEEISKIYGKKSNIILDISENPYESKILKLDCSKSKMELDWKPKINLKKGLEMTIDWYKEYEKQSNMRIVSEKQIDYFNSI